jgi:energy-coupling factor transport system ATP-binding protein
MESKKISTSTNIINFENFKIILDEGKISKTEVLEQTNIEIKRNKITCIVGPSGSGKTVLTLHLNGLLKSKYGNVDIDGFKILGKDKKIKNIRQLRRKVGMVFQFAEYQLFKDTILKDIIFAPLNLGQSKQEALSQSKKAIVDVGLDESFLERSPFELSGGQKRRVAIAGIFSLNPEIIVMDEPCGGLDPQGEKDILNIIMNMKEKEGKTAVIITQNMNHVLEIADEVIVMNEKKIIKQAPPYEVFLDENIVKEANLELPNIIHLIQHLITKDSKYGYLLEKKTRSIAELVKLIKKGEDK